MPGALPVLLALHQHEVSAILVILVGVIAGALAVVGARAAARSGNRNLHFVTAAFGVFAAKSVFTAWALWSRAIAHEDLETVLAIADLVVITLLALPLASRWTRARGRT